MTPPVLIVDVDTGRAESVNHQLPSAIRAPDLQSASTIGLVHCAKIEAGEYTNGTKAYDLNCALVLVARDKAGFQILGLRRFNTGALTSIRSNFSNMGGVVAERPEWAIKDFVAGLFPGR